MVKRRTPLNKLDIEILRILQKNCRISVGKIAANLGIPKSTVHYRIKKLEEDEIIEGYSAKINALKLGKDYTTITLVRVKFGPNHHEKIGKILAQIPGVSGVYVILGDQDFLVLCVSDNREDFMSKLEGIYNMPEIERTTTMVVMKTIKEDPRTDL